MRNGPGGHWRVTGAEVARFAAERTPPAAVIGYDITFSVPKSVSILWARSDAEHQAEILAAVRASVSAGVTYLEQCRLRARRQRRRPAAGPRAAGGVVPPGSSRALDPQLHAHVVVANMAEGPDGVVRALDGRALYAHAKTASYLAAAELRTQLSRRLGVAWADVEGGLADVAGVPRAAIVEMSKRAREMEQVLPQLEAFYTRGNGMRARGRQMAAYITRAAKDEHGVDPAALRPWWADQLDGVGFTERTLRRCYGRQAAVPLVTLEDRHKLFAHLGSAQDVTEMAATFTRRDVLQRVADWAGARLGAAEVCDVADAWLATEVVVRLDAPRRDARAGDVIRLRTGRTVSAVGAVGAVALYTTQDMLAVEQDVFAAYERGRDAGLAVAPAAHVDAALAERPYLGEDQVEMVRSICASGHRIQCVLGPAGSGKATALEAAARAWETAGHRPIGAVIQGTATEVLREATGIECSTVASLLARLDAHAADPSRPSPFDDRTVVLIDESSTLPNRELVRLARYAERAGAALCLVGDPAQHSAVAAGGG